MPSASASEQPKQPAASLACTECRRRKQKCNRQFPCQHCLARNIPSRCKPCTQQDRTKDALDRLEALEKELAVYRPLLRRLKREEGGRDVGTSPSIDLASDLEQVSDHEQAVDTGRDLRADVSGEKHLVGHLLDQVQEYAEQGNEKDLYQQEDTLDHALEALGATRGSSDLLSALPPRRQCDLLVSHFYQDINWIRQPWPQRRLRKSFQEFWASGPVLTAKSINTFALLSGICAIARLSIEHGELPGDSAIRLHSARRLHYISRHALMLSSILNQENIDQIIGWTLCCRFLTLDQRFGEAYTCSARSVKAAFRLKLHRDGEKFRVKMSEEEIEARRKVWSAVYHFDRFIAMQTGQPPSIEDRYCDTLAPTEACDNDVYTVSFPIRLAPGQPEPTPYAYCAHRHRLSVLQGCLIALVFDVRRRTLLEDVLPIDEELRKVEASLPDYLQLKNTPTGMRYRNTAFDETYGFLPVQRFLLQSEINALRISLFRPFVLRPGRKNSYARKIGLEAALSDLALYQSFTRQCNALSSLEIKVYVTPQRWFRSILICALVLMQSHPYELEQGIDSEYLLDLLDKFVKQACPSSSTATKTEVRIIKLFIEAYDKKRKAPKKHLSKVLDEDVGRPSKRHRESTLRSSLTSPSNVDGVTQVRSTTIGNDPKSDAVPSVDFSTDTSLDSSMSDPVWDAQQMFDMWSHEAPTWHGVSPVTAQGQGLESSSNVFGGTGGNPFGWPGEAHLQGSSKQVPIHAMTLQSEGSRLDNWAPQPNVGPESDVPSHFSRLQDSVGTAGEREANFWLELISKLSP